MPAKQTANVVLQHSGPTLLRVAMAVLLCTGWSMASPLPAASAEPFCQVQLGGKIATVPCGTCEDVLAEPGMAGNFACTNPPVPDPRSAIAPPARSDDAERLSPVDQQYVDELRIFGIGPRSTVKRLAETGPATCQVLTDAYRQRGSPSAGPHLKNVAASGLQESNPGLSWESSIGWVEAAVRHFCPDRVTGMRLE